MNKLLTSLCITFAFLISLYPTISISNSTGSPGGKTGSPSDVSNCMGCHSDAGPGDGADITTNIPINGYIPGSTYSITVSSSGNLFGTNGFEFTCEDNMNNKVGNFAITNSSLTQFVNNSNAVTHTPSGNSSSSWSFDWIAPPPGTGDITFYTAIIQGGYPIGQNNGDFFSSSSLTFNEAIVNTVNNLEKKDDFLFNSKLKTVNLLNCDNISIYNTNGKLVVSSSEKTLNLNTLLYKGVYILKSNNKIQKISIN
jgi:hypothetical protein